MVGVGIVGFGFGASVHLPAWHQEPRARVLGLCGHNTESSTERANGLGVPCQAWDEMLANEDIKVLSLSVPPAVQGRLIREAASAGKHIFCEKPVATSLTEARKTVDHVCQANVVHGIDFLFSAIPAWCETKRALQKIGGPQHFHLSWILETRAFREGTVSWKTRESEGGGPLANFISHSFHSLEWLFGPIVSLVCQRSGAYGLERQSGVDLMLRFSSGMSGTISLATDAPRGSGHRLEVHGGTGSLILANNSGDFARGFTLDHGTRTSDFQRLVEAEDSSGNQGFEDGRIEPVRCLVGRLLDAIEGQGEMQPNLHHGLRVQTLLDASLTSLLDEKWVSIAP